MHTVIGIKDTVARTVPVLQLPLVGIKTERILVLVKTLRLRKEVAFVRLLHLLLTNPLPQILCLDAHSAFHPFQKKRNQRSSETWMSINGTPHFVGARSALFVEMNRVVCEGSLTPMSVFFLLCY